MAHWHSTSRILRIFVNFLSKICLLFLFICQYHCHIYSISYNAILLPFCSNMYLANSNFHETKWTVFCLLKKKLLLKKNQITILIVININIKTNINCLSQWTTCGCTEIQHKHAAVRNGIKQSKSLSSFYVSSTST